MPTYDVVVIGTGVAAQTAATRLREAGRAVAVIDHRPFGGTCALRGCDPKKVLWGAAEAIDMAHRLDRHGLAGDLRVDWPQLIAFKRTFTEPVPRQREQEFASEGIDAFHGLARFTGPTTVAVDGEVLEGRHILIASGARPVPLGFPGEEHVITSDQFMELERLPARITFVGGGYIAAEFSTIAARAGAKVTVLQRGPRMLPPFEPELVGWLMEKFAEIGIAVRTGSAGEAVEQTDTGFRVHTRTDSGRDALDTDLVVHAAGRVPDLAALELPAGNVASDDGKLRLNGYLQSMSNPAVYAAGDAATKGPALTPVSSHDGKIVAANILEGNRHKPDYRGVPSVCFTLPPIAAVGLSEAKAREQGLTPRVNCARTSDWYTARRVREPVYGHKTIVAEDGRLIGAHLVGPHADEVINIFALAIRHGLTAEEFKNTLYAYPSGTSDIGYML